MKIVCLVENTSKNKLKAKHGLCFYIETKKHKILFDLGPDDTFLINAKALNIDLSKVDIVIISHGHMDHGGGLAEFLKINNTAKIYAQRSAFLKYYTKYLFMYFPIHLELSLAINRQIVMLDEEFLNIDEELYIIKSDGNKLLSNMNDNLYDMNKKPDKFIHEQHLFIKENKNVLFTGCCHTGIVNAIEKLNDISLDYCIGGFHTIKPMSKKMVSNEYLDDLSKELSKYNTNFYTCHCTGIKPYEYLKKKMNNINYISTGDILNIE